MDKTCRQVAAACGDDFEALWAALDAGPPPEWLAAQEESADEFDSGLAEALVDFLNEPSLDDQRAALDTNPQLLEADLDPLFAAFFEQCAGDEQALAYFQNQHDLIQACSEQGTGSVFAELAEQEANSA